MMRELHKGLLEEGLRSFVFTNSRDVSDYDSVTTVVRSKVLDVIRSQTDALFSSIYPRRQRIIFSTGMIGVDFARTDVYRQADIVHLHWINGGFVNIKHFSKIDKPMVWTLRDMWPMTGGCHYSMGCERFTDGCGKKVYPTGQYPRQGPVQVGH